MRTSFAVDLDLRPISINAPKTQPHTFRVGDVLFLTAPYATPYGDVPTDTKVFVQHIDEDDGTMWLRAEGDVPALFNWDNLLVAVPYDCDDMLACLRAAIRCPMAQVSPEEAPAPLPGSNVRQLGKLVLVAALATLTVMAPARLASHTHSLHPAADFHAAVGTTHLVNT